LFIIIRPFDDKQTIQELSDQAPGLSSAQVSARRDIFGLNRMKVNSRSVWSIFVDEVVNPFYIFQAYALLVWYIQGNYLFASVIALFSLSSICVTVWETGMVI
jgi:cation-transporting ATPase 13A3/4/5